MEGGSPTIRRRRLGRALHDLRMRAGMSGGDVGAAVERSASWISRVEGGRVGLRVIDLRQLLDVYGMDDERRREELEALAREGKQRGWWSRYSDALPESFIVFVGLEAAAQSIRHYDERLMPGALQTENYCRAVLRQSEGAVAVALTPEEIDARVRVRMERQLHLKESQPNLEFLLDEAVLYRTIGGNETLREQLDRLATAIKSRQVDLRVIPFSHGDRLVFANSYTLMSFRGDPAVVWHETPLGMTYEDGDKEVQTYSNIFDRLRAAALDTNATAALIEKARDRLS